MNARETQKQLLIEESELNRIQMGERIDAILNNGKSMVRDAKTMGWMASSAAILAGRFTNFQWGKTQAGRKSKPAYLQLFLQTTTELAALWLAYRTSREAKKDPPETESE
ncbi:MAG: hypothetical protein JJU29_06370 [Verrucomicrobia bacterium]|nr:hypothetical protein [Verrucomicrobiota bacterium]MCH8511492.1 hypothetical protein [Kiritimatiellia bacterium]